MNEFFSSRNRKKIDLTVFEPLLLFAVFFLPGYLSQGTSDYDPAVFESSWFNFIYIITTLPQILFIIYLIILKPGQPLGDYGIGKIRLKDILLSILTLAGIFACLAIAGTAAMLIEPDYSNSMIYGSGWVFSRPELLPLVFVSCILTGYSEEIFFRAYLINSLTTRGVSLPAAAVLNVLLFASGHIYEGLYAAGAILLIGGFLTFMFIKTRSIHTVAIGHGLYNFSVLLITMLGVMQ